MPSTPDNAAGHTNPHPGLGYWQYNQHGRSKGIETLRSRGKNTSRYELGRRDRYGERVTRIYPREVTKSPPAAHRYPTPTSPSGYSTLASPLLSAIGSTTQTAAQYTNEWTKSLPFFPGQQPASNGIPINGSLPVNHGSPSNSPRLPGARPLSHPTAYSNFGGRMQSPPPHPSPRDRRASMYSHASRAPFAVQPPPPHQLQPHFYGLPSVDFGAQSLPSDWVMAGSNEYYCGLDTLGQSGDAPSIMAENVLLAGYAGGLDVMRVEKKKMDLVGTLQGLRGSVVDAKILPWTARHDPFADSRPLIALTIHGPVLEEMGEEQTGQPSAILIGDNGNPPDPPTRPPSSRGDDPRDLIKHYQTTVEVYSLKALRHVATLYKSPTVEVSCSPTNPQFHPPPPVGDLRIDANGKFVVVASGTSGEVFIFAPYTKETTNHEERFRCIGKVWTAVKVREQPTTPNSPSSVDVSNLEREKTKRHGTPIFSLSHRWLAIVPPATSSVQSLNGKALVSSVYPKPPGINTQVAPPQPSVTCRVDGGEGEGFMKNVARGATQHVIKGASWVADQGVQALQNWWNKSSSSPSSQVGNAASSGSSDPPSQQGQQHFPPTHAYTPQASQASSDPVLVSIIDLQKVNTAEEVRMRNSLHPIATFPAPLGCSFLSFSPSGLMLMTVGRKGDHQFIWDLMRIRHGPSGPRISKAASKPYVRQVKLFTRMTKTTVVDVVWSAPRGERVALLTEKGTVHMYALPASDFQWPPSRRYVAKPSPPIKPQDGASAPISIGNASNPASNSTLSNAFHSITSSVRGRSSSAGATSMSSSPFSPFGALSMTPAVSAKSGKAVAASLGKSLGAATSNIRHARDNKLALPDTIHGVHPRSVRWLNGRLGGCVALVAGGVLRIYRVQIRQRSSRSGGGRTYATLGGGSVSTRTMATAIARPKKRVEFSVPNVPDNVFPPAVEAALQHYSTSSPVASPIEGESPYHRDQDQVKDGPPQLLPIEGNWVLKSLVHTRHPSIGAPLSPLHHHRTSSGPSQLHAEIETMAPRRPVFSERGVGVYVYNSSSSDLCSGDWIFGEEIPSTRVSVGHETSVRRTVRDFAVGVEEEVVDEDGFLDVSGQVIELGDEF